MPLASQYVHAAALGHLGRNYEAKAAIDAMLGFNPGFCLNFVDRMLPTNEEKVRNFILDGLRKAGLFE